MLLELPKPRMDEDYLGGQMPYEERTARRVKAGRMLRANRAFTALDDGEKVAITTDSYVVAEHAIARRYPDCFDLVLTARERAELLEAELEHAKQLRAERRLARAERRRAAKVRRVRAQVERLQAEAARAVRHALSVTTTQTRVTPGVWEIRSSPCLPTRVTVKPPEKPEYRVQLRDTQARARIVISGSAHDVIQRECLRFAGSDQLETGGLISGRYASTSGGATTGGR